MIVTGQEVREVFRQLKPGDRVEVEHTVLVGQKQWKTVVSGEVVRTERRRHGLHFDRNFDDRVFSNCIVLRRPDGELTTVTVDEFTVIRRIAAATASGEHTP